MMKMIKMTIMTIINVNKVDNEKIVMMKISICDEENNDDDDYVY